MNSLSSRIVVVVVPTRASLAFGSDEARRH